MSRVRAADLAEIKRRAEARGMTYSALLIASALERLPPTRDAIEAQREELEAIVERVDRLEQFAFAAN